MENKEEKNLKNDERGTLRVSTELKNELDQLQLDLRPYFSGKKPSQTDMIAFLLAAYRKHVKGETTITPGTETERRLVTKLLAALRTRERSAAVIEGMLDPFVERRKGGTKSTKRWA